MFKKQHAKTNPTGIKKATFVFFTIIVALLLLELSLRLCGYIYLRLKYPLEDVQRKSKESFNILCLGDSFTQGFGAPSGYSYPEQLAKLLNDNPIYKNKCNVYKEFRINSSTILKYLTKDIEKYNPELIIIMTGCNDRWSLENCTYFALGKRNFLTKLDIWLSSCNVYKLAKVFFLNLKGLLVKSNSRFTQKATAFNQVNDEPSQGQYAFESPEAQKHYDMGNYFFYAADYDLALKEFKVAEQLDPANAWVHLMLTTIYMHVLHDWDLGKKHGLLAVRYGDSVIVDHVAMLLCYPNNENNTIIAEIEDVIKIYYKGNEKIKALEYLKILSAFHNDRRKIEKMLSYNLNEIVKIIRSHNVKVILIHYPHRIAGVREIVDSKAHLFRIPLVDNYADFEERLKDTKIKREGLFVKDGHCNAKGYSIVAENVYNSLIQNKIIDDVINK